jgi:hypothetical protein
MRRLTYIFIFPGLLAAQCLLVNPSFELLETAMPAGWNRFGDTSLSAEAVHGFYSLQLAGLHYVPWQVSAVWQELPGEAGEEWSYSAWLRITGEQPLLEASCAILNLEWRDAAGSLIGYQSHSLADWASPADEWILAEGIFGPAPVGTASVHLLAGLLQDAQAPASVIQYDQLTIYSHNTPTIEEAQWLDFPTGNSLSFAGYNWRLKGNGWYGPGDNWFSADSQAVYTDESGLHLVLQEHEEIWHCAELALEQVLGYGDYRLQLRGNLAGLDPQVIFGFFLWQYQRCWPEGAEWWNPYNEIDFELGRWGDHAALPAQMVVQPWNAAGNLERFDLPADEDLVITMAFNWQADQIDFRCWQGSLDQEESSVLLDRWTYAGPQIPRPEIPRLHLNLWKLSGEPASTQHLLVQDFRFQAGESPSEPISDLAICVTDARIELSWTQPDAATTSIVEQAMELAGPWLVVAEVDSGHVQLAWPGEKAFYRVRWE